MNSESEIGMEIGMMMKLEREAQDSKFHFISESFCIHFVRQIYGEL